VERVWPASRAAKIAAAVDSDLSIVAAVTGKVSS
jgi:hypothetical protein